MEACQSRDPLAPQEEEEEEEGGGGGGGRREEDNRIYKKQTFAVGIFI